jgi:hypothetical protein
MPLDQVMNVSSYNQSLTVAHANAVAWVDANVGQWIAQGVNITSLAVGNEPFVLGSVSYRCPLECLCLGASNLIQD